MQRLQQLAKRRARGLVDRIARPYVDEIVAAQPTPVAEPALTDDAAADGRMSEFFHMVNHELRTMELERVPKGATRALSVGAQGGWYFDWFEKAVGPLTSHIGIEAFEPEPDDLPGYVTWIPDTADHMDRVGDATVDLVFAGQTSEHLWADELAGFLVEAHRVLAADGLLVLDSPNRLVTEHLRWGHGGHTVELSAAEITELLQLAGFAVESTTGLWRCRFGDRVLQLEEALDDGPTVVRRIAEGPAHVDDSFVWWINARRVDREPDTALLAERTAQLFDAHWPTRVCRGLFPTPTSTALTLREGDHGLVGTTLPYPMHGGQWVLRLRLASGELRDVSGLQIRIVAPGGLVVHELHASDARVERDTLIWDVEQPYLLFALVLEIHVDAVAAPISIELPLDLRPLR